MYVVLLMAERFGKTSTSDQTALIATVVALRSVLAKSTLRVDGTCISACRIPMVACMHACSEQVDCSGKVAIVWDYKRAVKTALRM